MIGDADEARMQALVDFMLQTGMSTDRLPAFQRMLRAAFDAGVADERAAVVAWLRYEVGRTSLEWGSIYRNAADAIERAAHR